MDREQERHRLINQITEWNGNRLDLFEISLPNEKLEFYGVIRFFYQGDDGKYQSKCLRVTSTATTRNLVSVLIEKFHPDLKMLSNDRYGLYENHSSNKDRRLNDNEIPLILQLNWAQDDREGKFILKNETHPVKETNNNQLRHAQSVSDDGGLEGESQSGFKRRWSSKKKKRKGSMSEMVGGENAPPTESSRPPDSSFTRTISNPDEVMRRKRAQKLEQRLQQLNPGEGGSESGGTLKIYGDAINTDVPYKTLLLSVNEHASSVVKDTLEKYGLDSANPLDYCLVQVNLPPRGEQPAPGEGREFRLRDTDCPLGILVHQPPARGNAIFQIRPRNACHNVPIRPTPMPPGADQKSRMQPPGAPGPMPNGRQSLASQGSSSIPSQMNANNEWPYLVHLNPDGSDRGPSALTFPLPGLWQGQPIRIGSKPQVVGPRPNIPLDPQHFPGVRPMHCQLRCPNNSTQVMITPAMDPSAKPPAPAPLWINNTAIMKGVPLQSGVSIRLSPHVLFRFIDPGAEQKYMNQQQQNQPHQQTDNDEQTDLLPVTIEYLPEYETALLDLLITSAPPPQLDQGKTKGSRFQLAPAYTLYLLARACLRQVERSRGLPAEKEHRLAGLINQLANKIYQVIQRDRNRSDSLAYWMANGSEMLHCLKQDVDFRTCTSDAQDTLAGAIEQAFNCLYALFADKLADLMPAFLRPDDADLQEQPPYEMDPTISLAQSELEYPTLLGPILLCLERAMDVLRGCRVNAALTIQLYSQLFHLVNRWLFNRLVSPQGMALCSFQWGDRLQRRLNRITSWSLIQGLEMAAECHLMRIMQACRVLTADMSNLDSLYAVCMDQLRLNSFQMNHLLSNYQDFRLPDQWIDVIVAGARELSDQVQLEEQKGESELFLEEEERLSLALLLPADGYSIDMPIEGVPPGLSNYLTPLASQDLIKQTINTGPEVSWTAYMAPNDSVSPHPASKSGTLTNQSSFQSNQQPHIPSRPLPTQPPVPQTDDVDGTNIMVLKIKKINKSLGLSIVAAKGDNESPYCIYVKEVVPNGAAQRDGRLATGDQLLAVEGVSLVGVTQDEAAQVMGRTGQEVTITIDKGASHRRGLYHLIAQHQNSKKPVQGQQNGDQTVMSTTLPRHSQQPPPMQNTLPRPGVPKQENNNNVGPIHPSISESILSSGTLNRPGQGQGSIAGTLPRGERRFVKRQDQIKMQQQQERAARNQGIMSNVWSKSENAMNAVGADDSASDSYNSDDSARDEPKDTRAAPSAAKTSSTNQGRPPGGGKLGGEWKSSPALNDMDSDTSRGQAQKNFKSPPQAVSKPGPRPQSGVQPSGPRPQAPGARPQSGPQARPQRGPPQRRRSESSSSATSESSTASSTSSGSTVTSEEEEVTRKKPTKAPSDALRNGQHRPPSQSHRPPSQSHRPPPEAHRPQQDSEDDDDVSNHVYSNLPPIAAPVKPRPIAPKVAPPALPQKPSSPALSATPSNPASDNEPSIPAWQRLGIAPPAGRKSMENSPSKLQHSGSVQVSTVRKSESFETSRLQHSTSILTSPTKAVSPMQPGAPSMFPPPPVVDIEPVWTETDLDRNRETRHDVIVSHGGHYRQPPMEPFRPELAPQVHLRRGDSDMNSLTNRTASIALSEASLPPPYTTVHQPLSQHSFNRTDSPSASPNAGRFFQATSRTSIPPSDTQHNMVASPRSSFVPSSTQGLVSRPSIGGQPVSMGPMVSLGGVSAPLRGQRVTSDRSPTPELPPPPQGIYSLPAEIPKGPPSPPLPSPPTDYTYHPSSLPQNYPPQSQPSYYQTQPPAPVGQNRFEHHIPPPPPKPTADYPQYHPPSQVNSRFSHGPNSIPPPIPITRPGNRANADSKPLSPIDKKAVEKEFQRRLEEETLKDRSKDDEEEDLASASMTKPEDEVARVALIRSVRESLERGHQLRAAQDMEQKERLKQLEQDIQDKQQRQAELDGDRKVQQERADQRAIEHEEWLRKQKTRVEENRETDMRNQDQQERRPRYGRPRFDPSAGPAPPEPSRSGPVPGTSLTSEVAFLSRPSEIPGGDLTGTMGKKSVSFDTNLASICSDQSSPSRESDGGYHAPPPKPKPKPAANRPVSSFPLDQTRDEAPNVLGSNEVYRDRRSHVPSEQQTAKVEALSFKDKINLFGQQAQQYAAANEDPVRFKVSSRLRMLEQNE